MAIMGRNKQRVAREMYARLSKEEKLAREIANKTKEEKLTQEEHQKRIEYLKGLGLIK
jgi:uncharacterized protein YnzC (UPF0291/DUF896 family)